LVDELLLTPIPADVADPERMAYVGDTVLRSVAAVTRGARVKPGQSAAVFGLGGAGLSAIVAAKAMGAGVIFAVGAGAEASARAALVGASETADLADGDVEARVLARCPGGVDHLIYCPDEYGGQYSPSGKLVADGGTAHLVASAGTPARQAVLSDCASSGVYDADPPADPETDIGSVLRWMADGSFDPARSIRQRYTIEQVNEAVMDLENGADGQAILVVEALR
jgi:Zn-dependent alcohol dehydrogenase